MTNKMNRHSESFGVSSAIKIDTSTMLEKLALFVIFVGTLLVLPTSGQKCLSGGRCLPDEPCWPNNEQWQVGFPDIILISPHFATTLTISTGP